MVPDRDYYVDKDGKLTDDPTEYARQIAVKGCFVDERTARQYGIGGDLVSVDEPGAPRRMIGSIPSSRRSETARNEASVKIVKPDEKPAEEKNETSEKPQEPAGAKAKKPAAKKEKKQS